MKILFLSTAFPDAAQPTHGAYNLETCCALAKEHDVRVISPRPWPRVVTEKLSGGRMIPCEVTWAAGIRAEFPTYWYPPKALREQYGEFLWRSCRRTVVSLSREFQPDAVLSYWAHPDGDAAVRAATMFGCPAAIITGGSDVLLLPRRLSRGERVRQVLQSADAVLAVSNGVRQAVIDLGVDADCVHTVYQGVNIDRFHAGDRQAARAKLSAQHSQLNQDRPLLLWAGRMVDVKRLDVLLDACAELQRRGIEFSLCLAGDGPLRSSVHRWIRERRLNGSVYLLGSLAPASLGDWYRAADRTVLTSDSEGLPNVLRESLACGTPFVATDVGSIGELADGPYATLVPAGQPTALADALAASLKRFTDESPRTPPPRSWDARASEIVQILEQCRARTHRTTVTTSQSDDTQQSSAVAQPRTTDHGPRTNKRLLYVSYLFPPTGGVGVLRTTKFVKYLPEFGWAVTVLTAENPSVPLVDESLLAEVPEQTVIRTARTCEPGYAVKKMVADSADGRSGITGRVKSWLKSVARRIANGVLQPDTAILWYLQAVREGLRALREQTFDAIVVSAPPFSSLLVGATLTRKTGVPLVLDYRDEWTISNAYWENKRQGRIGNWLQQRMQRHVLRAAWRIVGTTPGSAAAIGRLAAEASSRASAACIYNGFDPADFPARDELLTRADYGHGRDRFRIAFVGTLWTLTSIEPFVRAVRLLADRHPQLLDELEIVIAGRQVGAEIGHLETLASLPCQFVNLSFLEHDEALRLMATSDRLLQLQSDVPGAERVIASKLFEYLGARRPILAITGEGDHCDIVRELPHVTVCPPHDIAGIADALALRLEAHRCGVDFDAEDVDISRYERRNLTGELAQILDEMRHDGQKNFPPVSPASDARMAEAST